MRAIVLFLAFLLFTNESRAQTDSVRTSEELSYSTICIYQPQGDDTHSGGVGLIINHKGKYFLLTAAHVSRMVHPSAQLIFKTSYNSSSVLLLSDFLKKGKMKWIEHPNADISILELTSNNATAAERLNKWSFPSGLISHDKEPVTDGQPILFWMFSFLNHSPKGYYYYKINPGNKIAFDSYNVLDYNIFLPEVVGANVLPGGIRERKRFDKKSISSMYFLDVEIRKESDGSGVFCSFKTHGTLKTLLVGIVHGIPEADYIPRFPAVTPAYYIWDILEK